MSEVVFRCNKLKKRLNKCDKIEDVSFEVRKGDILGIIGKNGAGKTSTIKLILGLYKLTNGSVQIAGYDLKKDFVEAISSVGAVIENPDLYTYLSGYENLQMVASFYDISMERITEIVDMVGMKEKIYDKVAKYSLGQRQRLGIAQAILHHPKILILDEPMNGLDPQGIMDFKKLLLKLAKSGMAIIVSSHILSELESFCNRICMIHRGKVIMDTTINELKKIAVSNYILEVNQVCLNDIIDDYEVLDSQHIKVKIGKEDINCLLAKIIQAGIFVYEVKKEALSLEEMFFAKIGDNHA